MTGYQHPTVSRDEPLETEAQQARRRFAREALAGWAEFRATELHLTGEEIRRWLRTWDTDGEGDIPKCHR